MKQRHFLQVSAFAAAFAFSLLAGASAHALRLQPALIELSLKPGESSVQSIRLLNDSQNTLNLGTMLYDADAGNNEKGFPAFSPNKTDSTLSNWIKLNGGIDTFQLAPNESKMVSFSISVPTDAPFGGHYAGLGFTTPSQIPEAGGASLSGGIITNIALDVEGAVLEKGDIVSFSTAGSKASYDKLPISFVTRINNGGNRHFKPQGSIQVKNMFGTVVATLPLNVTNGGGNVLPRSTREFNNTWEGEFAFGKYTAALTADLGGAGIKTANFELWVMPAGLLILWLIIALIIIVILVLLIKRALQPSSAMKK